MSSKQPRLKIGRLRMAVPSAYGERAAALARTVVDRLAHLPISGSAKLDRLEVPPVVCEPGMTDHAMAERIARAIHGGLGPRRQ